MIVKTLEDIYKNMTLKSPKGFFVISSIHRKDNVIIVVNCQTHQTHRVRFAAIKGMEIVE